MKFRLQFFKLKKVHNLIGGVTSTVSGVTSKPLLGAPNLGPSSSKNGKFRIQNTLIWPFKLRNLFIKYLKNFSYPEISSLRHDDACTSYNNNNRSIN